MATVQPGGDATATDWNRLVDTMRTLDENTSDRRWQPCSLRMTRTSSGTIPDYTSSVLAWPDEPDLARGIEVTRNGEAFRLPEPGVYLASVSLSVQTTVKSGHRLLVWIADADNGDNRYGENAHSLPAGYPIVSTAAVVTIREPTEISVWTWNDAKETLPIYASAVRTMFTIHRLARGGLGGDDT